MSSLRLALKQSLVESGGGPTKKEKSERKRADQLRKQQEKQQRLMHQQQQQHTQTTAPPSTLTAASTSTTFLVDPRSKRKPGDPPRKRGRPRKHPLPPSGPDKAASLAIAAAASPDSSSSDENEFSGSSSDESQDEPQSRSTLTEQQDKGLFESDDDSESDSDRNDTDENDTDDDDIESNEKKPKEHSAANMIQSQWKRKKEKNSMDNNDTPKSAVTKTSRASSPKPTSKQHDTETTNTPSTTNGDAKKKASAKAHTVPPPSIDIIDWMETLSTKKKRRHMNAGLRVKVRFSTKVRKRDQKVIKKLKWYGGLVTAVSTGGSKIRIKYDDGTSEVSTFPDKDVVVDDQDNGQHRVSADVYLPPDDEEQIVEPSEDDDEPDPVEKEQKTRVKKPQKRDPNFTSPKTDTDDSHASVEERVLNKSPTSPLSIIDDGEGKQHRPKFSGGSGGTWDATKSPATATAATSISASTDLDSKDDREIEEKLTSEVKEDPPEQSPQSNGGADDKNNANEEPAREQHFKVDLHGRNGRTFAATDDSSDDDDDASMEVIEESTLPQEEAKAAFARKPVEQVDKNDGGEADNEDESGFHNGGKKRSRDDDDDDDNDDTINRKMAKLDKRNGPMSNVDQNGNDDDEEAEFDDEEPQRTWSAMANKKVLEGQDDDIGNVGENKITKKKPKPIPIPEDAMDETEGDEENEEISAATKRKRDVRESDSSIKVPSGRFFDIKSPKGFESPIPVLSERLNSKETLPKPDAVLASSSKSMDDLDDEFHEKDPPSPVEISKHSAFEKKEKKKLKKNKELSGISSEEQFAATPSMDRMDDLDALNIPRSGRRAAQAANERIVSRQELVIQDEYTKPKKKRVDIKGPDGRERKRKENDDDESNESDDDHHWVQCDSCSKWRVLPATVDVDALPKNWYCKLNIYDSIRNNCEAAEQTAQEVAKAKRKAKRKLARLARMESPINAQPVIADDPDPLREKNPKEERRKKKVGRPPKERKDLAPGKKEGKRRDRDERPKRASPVPMQSDGSGQQSPGEDSGSDSQNKVDPRKKLNIGSAKRPREGVEEEAKESVSLMADIMLAKIKGKRPRGRPAKEHFANKDGKVSNDKSSDPDNQEWVQCEKCEKWRRLPPQISAADLPDVWYCNMNTWDPHSATCEAQEDKADPGHAPVTGFAGGNKLSYRNLIFGTGKKHNRPISERTRAAESLFSSHPFDQSHEHHPVVLYANSSVFVSRGNPSKTQDDKETDRPSLFDFMNRTSLWSELWGIAQQRAEKNAYSPHGIQNPSDIVVDTLPSQLKKEMKELVLHALGSGELASHEVLLEIQSTPWKNIPAIWSDLRTLCTAESTVTIMLELVKEGRVEAVESTDSQVSVLGAMPKFRRLVKREVDAFAEFQEKRVSNCMKISKPWKFAMTD